MFVYNLRLNFKKILIITAIIIVIVALFLEISSMKNNKKLSSFDYILDNENFTQVLKTVHDNIDENIGKTIKLSGFVFRLPDFRENYFVCGRNMIFEGEEKVVGFLCTYDQAITLNDSQWIEIEGSIINGYYTIDMPVIKVESIKKITAPANTFVKTPDFL